MALNKQQQNAVAVVVLVALGIGALFKYVIMPLNKSINSKVEDLKKTNAKILELVREAAQLGQLERQIDLLKRELAESEKALPSSEDVANLLRYITETSQITGVSIKNFRPENEVRKQYFSELPFVLEIDSTYHSLAQFLNTVNQAERIITTRDLSIVPVSGGDSGENVKASLKLSTFMIK